MSKDKVRILLEDNQVIECDKLVAFIAKGDVADYEEGIITGKWETKELGEIFLQLRDLLDKEIYKSLASREKDLFDSIQDQRASLEKDLYSSLNESEQQLYEQLYQESRLEVADVNLSDEFDNEIQQFFDDLLDNIQQDKNKEENKNKEQDIVQSDADNEKVVNLAEFKNQKGR